MFQKKYVQITRILKGFSKNSRASLFASVDRNKIEIVSDQVEHRAALCWRLSPGLDLIGSESAFGISE